MYSTQNANVIPSELWKKKYFPIWMYLGPNFKSEQAISLKNGEDCFLLHVLLITLDRLCLFSCILSDDKFYISNKLSLKYKCKQELFLLNESQKIRNIESLWKYQSEILHDQSFAHSSSLSAEISNED